MTVLRQCQKCGGNPSDRDYGQEYWVECESCGFSPGKFKNRFCADVEWNSPSAAPTQGADARPVAAIDDARMLIQRLAHSLRKAAPDNALCNQAMDYLKRTAPAGTMLRDGDQS